MENDTLWQVILLAMVLRWPSRILMSFYEKKNIRKFDWKDNPLRWKRVQKLFKQSKFIWKRFVQTVQRLMTVYRLGQSMLRFLLTFSKITTIFYLLSRISQINTLHCDASQYFKPWFSHKKRLWIKKTLIK